MSVAITVRRGSTVNGEPDVGSAVTYLGTNLGSDPQWPTVNFAGVAASERGQAVTATPVSYDGTTEDGWPQDGNGSLFRTVIDEVLPDFVDDPDLAEPLPFGGADQIIVTDVGIGGTVVPVTWEVVSLDAEDVTVRVDDEFDQDTIHRGYAFRVVGRVVGEFRVDRHNLMDLEGRVDITFEIIDDDSSSARHQWWSATPAPDDRRDETWRTGLDGIERITEIRRTAPPDPDLWLAAFGYGGGVWSGRLEIEQTWSQATRELEPTEVRSELGVDSRFTDDGQWLTTTLRRWSAGGPPFGTEAAGELGPDMAFLVSAPGRISNAYPEGSAEIESRSQRIWFGEVLMQSLPAFPAERITVGTTWQVRLLSEEDGAGPRYTVIALDDGLLTLEIEGDYGTYYGDRYDGYTVAAEISGTLVIDWAAGIPVEVDISTVGTITFAIGGEPDPATTEPWQSTFVVRAHADDE